MNVQGYKLGRYEVYRSTDWYGVWVLTPRGPVEVWTGTYESCVAHARAQHAVDVEGGAA